MRLVGEIVRVPTSIEYALTIDPQLRRVTDVRDARTLDTRVRRACLELLAPLVLGKERADLHGL